MAPVHRIAKAFVVCHPWSVDCRPGDAVVSAAPEEPHHSRYWRGHPLPPGGQPAAYWIRTRALVSDPVSAPRRFEGSVVLVVLRHCRCNCPDTPVGFILAHKWGTYFCTRPLWKSRHLGKPEHQARLVYFSESFSYDCVGESQIVRKRILS